MRQALSALLAGALFAGSSPVWAADANDGPLARGARLVATRPLTVSAFQAPQQPAARQRSWVSRHPVLFGTLLGTASGAALGSLEDCKNTGFGYCSRGASVAGGAVIGAGVGSLTGFFISRAKR